MDFRRQANLFLHALNAKATWLKRTGGARLGFHGHLQSGGGSSGRWSRRGREVPLGKRHLLPAPELADARSTPPARCAGGEHHIVTLGRI
jgi:hypothetical protein